MIACVCLYGLWCVWCVYKWCVCASVMYILSVSGVCAESVLKWIRYAWLVWLAFWCVRCGYVWLCVGLCMWCVCGVCAYWCVVLWVWWVLGVDCMWYVCGVSACWFSPVHAMQFMLCLILGSKHLHVFQFITLKIFF